MRHFYPTEKVLVASFYSPKHSERSTSEDISLLLAALEKVPSLLALEDSEAVKKHITSWCNQDKKTIEIYLPYVQCSIRLVDVEAANPQV